MMEKNTRKITGMKIDRKRPGRKMQEVPQRLTFFNEAGKSICGITIYPEIGHVHVHPHGATVAVFNRADQPLRKQSSSDDSIDSSCSWVTNGKYGEIIFPEAAEE